MKNKPAFDKGTIAVPCRERPQFQTELSAAGMRFFVKITNDQSLVIIASRNERTRKRRTEIQHCIWEERIIIRFRGRDILLGLYFGIFFFNSNCDVGGNKPCGM